MNLSPINFKGTFCIPESRQLEANRLKAFNKICRYSPKIDVIRYRDTINETHISVADSADKKIEKILAKYSIPNYYININSRVDIEEVLKRIKIDEVDEMFGDRLININVAMLDKALQQRPGYVGYKGQGGSKDKYERFKLFLRTKNEIRAPQLSLIKGVNGKVEVVINDGRHRFAVLRDMGCKTIPVQISEKSIKIGQEAGIF